MLSQPARATNYGQFTQITLSSDGIPLFQGQGVFAVSIAATLPLLGRVDLVPPKLQSACSRAHRVPVRLGLQSIKQIESHMIILEKFLCAQLRPSTTPIFISIFLWNGMPFSSRGLFPSPIRYQHKTNGSTVQKAVRSPARGQEGGKNEAEEETRCANNMGHRHGNQSKSELLFHAEISGRKPGNVALLNSPCKYGIFCIYWTQAERQTNSNPTCTTRALCVVVGSCFWPPFCGALVHDIARQMIFPCSLSVLAAFLPTYTRTQVRHQNER